MDNRIEQQDDFVPGTIYLVDVKGVLRTKHASGAQHDIVLVPAPSDDPDDPLNWTPRRKLLSIVCLNVYILMVGIASAAIYSVLIPISTETGLSLNDLNAGTGYLFLFLGWGCLFWQPLALQYGKRPVYLISILATMALMIWAPFTTTNGQWIANKILQGFFGAPVESLCEASVTDVYFTHERGFYMAMYGLFLAGSNFFAPVIAGFIADGQGWQWVLYWCAIFCGAGFVFLLFFMEETNYRREGGKITGLEHKDNATPISKKAPLAQPPPPQRTDPKQQDDEKGTIASPPSPVDSGEEDVVSDRQTKSYAARMRLFQPGVFSSSQNPNQLAGMVVRPLIFLSFPVVAYAGFAYGANLVWFNVLNATASLVLSGQPYNFSASMVGLSYVSPLVGVFLSAAYTGKFGDWFVIRMARNRDGVMEPEYRLWLFVASLVLIPLGLLLWGVGAAHGVHWFGLVFAMGVIAATNVTGLQLSISYAIDSYRDLAGEVIVTVILIRNTMSFAIGYGVTPWVENMGYQNAFVVATVAGLAQTLIFLVFVKWGKKWRTASRDRYLTYVDKVRRAGLSH